MDVPKGILFQRSASVKRKNSGFSISMLIWANNLESPLNHRILIAPLKRQRDESICVSSKYVLIFFSFYFLPLRHDNGWSPRIWTSHSGSHQQENWRFPTCHFYLQHPPAAVFSPQCPFKRSIHSSVHWRTRIPVSSQRSAPEKVCPRNSHTSRPWEKSHPEFTWHPLFR